ncbi:MAG: RluA family pseudouridine synthase [Clostridia bacterium]|jgi:23S rRNA pseudouridine955/2504/2580 synthase|nr:RluA family pseudouridine synthase [Clostridia bacterium]
MKEFTITKNDASLRLDKFITKNCPTLPSSLMFKYIRTKRIKVNGKRAEISTRLNAGDKVEAYINDEFFTEIKPTYDFLSAPSKLDIVYEDENILLADKKQGLLVHPDKNEYTNTLIARIQHYLYDKGEYDPQDENSFRPALANRIDRNTGGIVIAAKNAEALRILCDKIKCREIDKRYLTVVHGIPKKKTDLLEGYLEKDEDKNRVYMSKKSTDTNKFVRTKYTVLQTLNNLSLLEIELLTGRTHQIRAHMAAIGHPLLGEGKYSKSNDKKSGFDKQALYSYSLKFDFKTDAGILNYLNGKRFTVKEVWFADKLFGDSYKRLL